MAQNMIAFVDKCARQLALLCIGFYRLCLSPFFGNGCRFSPTCSDYARQVFTTHSAPAALFLTLRRLSRCHPFCAGGEDLPPRAKHD